jgi:UDP-glucose 4-epimerase
MEFLLKDMAQHKGFSVVCLRYFNPVGAHHSGLLGENPK